MITLQNVSLQRGGKFLLRDVNLKVSNGQRAALIGANGSGKTSLFELLQGRLSCDQGEVELPRQVRIAHMAQETPASERSAHDWVLDGDAGLRAAEQRIALAQQRHDDNALAAAYAEFEAADGYSAGYRAEQLLSGLGFAVADFQRSLQAFSGGWRIRLNLAQALMSPSNLLLLDEPTNHLDLDATLWLEQWLKAYQGTLILISHDRDFIDSIASHIIHLERAGLSFYRGNYSDFERQRSEQLAQQQAEYVKQQRSVAQMQRFVARFGAKASKAKQAQSRLKTLQRMEMIAPAHVDSPFNFVFAEPQRASSPLMVLEQASIGYDDSPVIEQLNLSIATEARIGLLGPNGAGKSTLIKSLVGELQLIAGKRHCGAHLKVGYFAQHQLEALDMRASPATHIQRLSPEASEQSIRNFLGGFDFHGDVALGPITHFSGGEKARLALALVVWQAPNLIIMDEPTNHLDIEMRHALTLALQGFQGAVILVAHDRHLLRSTVDEFWLVAQGRVAPFDGDLHDYQRWFEASRRGTAKSDETSAGLVDDSQPVSAPENRDDRRERRRREAAQRQKRQPLQQRLQRAESEMHEVQNEIATLESELAEPSVYEEANKDRLQALLQRQGELKNRLQISESDWLAAQEALENVAD